MAACESLPNFLEKPLQEINPTTPRQSLSQCQHFNSLEEHPSLSSSSSSSSSASPTSSSSWTSSFSSSSFSIDFITPLLDNENLNHKAKNENKHGRHGRSFSSVNSCAEDISTASSKRYRKLGRCIRSHSTNEYESICESLRSKRSQITGEEFPPPIPSIGRSGKPWVSLKSYKQNGRFILKEVRIPIQEFLHACREDGRLKMQIIQSDEEEEDYNDASNQRCDYCSNSDKEYNGQKDIGDEEDECF